jgi:hypothetical protein
MLQPSVWYYCAYVDHVQTQALFLPPSTPPICLQSLTRDIKRAGVGRGRSRCWSSPVSCAPTEFSHGSDPSNMPAATGTFVGSPFYRENTPVGATEPKSTTTTELGERGGGVTKERREAWCGGGRAGNACVIFEIPPL